MQTTGKNLVFFSVILILINLLLTFFLIAVLMDGIVNSKLGIIITAPFMLAIPAGLTFLFIEYFKQRNIASGNFAKTVALILLSLLNILIYLYNVILFIDLFDGKKNALLP